MTTPFYTGASGRGTGPHLDFRIWDVEKGAYVDPTPYTSILTSGDQLVADAFPMTSGYGMRTHPTLGGRRMHHGIDFGTPEGTPITVGGEYLGTWRDGGGGGIMSQYAFTGDDGRKYEAILLHGSDENRITGRGPITGSESYPTILARQDASLGQSPSSGSDIRLDDRGLRSAQQSAAERVKAYQSMSKSELDAAYDTERKERPVTAAERGLEMHRAYFRK